MDRSASSAGRGAAVLGKRNWATILLVGFFGQVAWTIENMYFNLFVYETISRDPDAIAFMVAASAVVATLTTLFMGAYSDRVGRRKRLIVCGYVLWGLSTMAFALLSPESGGLLRPLLSTGASAVLLVVLMDCLMTFFGSTANDAAFNAWLTDVTAPSNRGRVEGVLAAMPLLSMLLVFALLDPLTRAGRWSLFFLIVGASTALAGLLSLPLIRERALPRSAEPFAGTLFYGLRPAVARRLPTLYLALLALFIASAASQVYLPYLIIYIQNYLKIADYALVLGLVLTLSSLLSVLGGKLIDRLGKIRFAYLALLIELLGLGAMFFVRTQWPLVGAGLLTLSGFMLLAACLNGLVKDHIPQGQAGRFQGVRMIFAVMLPMIVGPFVGSAAIRNSTERYSELGQVRQVPTPALFPAAALVLLFLLLPLLWLSRRRRRAGDGAGTDGPSTEEASAEGPGGAADRAVAGRAPDAARTVGAADELIALKSAYFEEALCDCPLAEYPRPQLRRAPESWHCLNGLWEYAIRKGALPAAEDAAPPWPGTDGMIRVPFAPEALLSGVGRWLRPDERLCYRRYVDTAELPFPLAGGRVFIRFGAVDQLCRLYVNGRPVGAHAGGYWSFSFDLSAFLHEGKNELMLLVSDPTQTGPRAYGKQTLERGKIWYSPSSGIWQTVWLEKLPDSHIDAVKITPRLAEGKVRLEVRLSASARAADAAAEGGSARGAALRGRVLTPDGPAESAPLRRVADGSAEEAGRADAGRRCVLEAQIPACRPWSPESPYLYRYELRCGEDRVEGYFAMREFGLTKDGRGRPRLALNGRPYVHVGVLDQGYWSDGLYTPPSDRALREDILAMKALGFNMLRKHIKIEAARWYYHCDKLGMLVWQDMVSGGGPYRPAVIGILPWLGLMLNDRRRPARFGRASEESRAVFREELERTVEQLYSVPSLALWVPFNEGWGQFDSAALAERVRTLDGTRPLDHASGWHDQGAGDLKSRHVYFKKVRLRDDRRGRPLALTEFGGYSYGVPGHCASKRAYGYKPYRSPEDYRAGVLALLDGLLSKPARPLSALVYTQLSDVEDEINGLLTYDRQVNKWPEEGGAAAALRARLERFKELP